MSQLIAIIAALGLLFIGVAVYVEYIPASAPIICATIALSGFGTILMLDAVRAEIKRR